MISNDHFLLWPSFASLTTQIWTKLKSLGSPRCLEALAQYGLCDNYRDIKTSRFKFILNYGFEIFLFIFLEITSCASIWSVYLLTPANVLNSKICIHNSIIGKLTVSTTFCKNRNGKCGEMEKKTNTHLGFCCAAIILPHTHRCKWWHGDGWQMIYRFIQIYRHSHEHAVPNMYAQ